MARDPNIITKEIHDPIKEAVSGPLSKYLASQIGRGMPRYEGKLYEPLDPMAEMRYKEFLGMDPEKFFKEKVTRPTMEEWGKEVAPIVKEGWAGNLRGSGRFKDVEDSAGAMTKQLGVIGGQMVPDIYGKQFSMGVGLSALKTQQYALEWKNWMSGLPEMNPNLDRALAFLGMPTGMDTLAFLDPGEQAWWKDALSGLMGGIGTGVGMGAGAAMFCWVAAEIFGGWNKPKTNSARYYIGSIAPAWFRNFYHEYGERIAAFIHDKPIFKMLLRPLFELFALRGVVLREVI